LLRLIKKPAFFQIVDETAVHHVRRFHFRRAGIGLRDIVENRLIGLGAQRQARLEGFDLAVVGGGSSYVFRSLYSSWRPRYASNDKGDVR
jgi:hypothetical protein